VPALRLQGLDPLPGTARIASEPDAHALDHAVIAVATGGQPGQPGHRRLRVAPRPARPDAAGETRGPLARLRSRDDAGLRPGGRHCGSGERGGAGDAAAHLLAECRILDRLGPLERLLGAQGDHLPTAEDLADTLAVDG